MAQDAGKQTLGILPLEGVHVRVAQRVGHDLDADLASPRWRDDDGLVAQRLVSRPRHSGFAPVRRVEHDVNVIAVITKINILKKLT